MTHRKGRLHSDVAIRMKFEVLLRYPAGSCLHNIDHRRVATFLARVLELICRLLWSDLDTRNDGDCQYGTRIEAEQDCSANDCLKIHGGNLRPPRG